jgi:elongation factor Tu
MGWWPFGRRSARDKDVDVLLAEADAASPPSRSSLAPTGGFRLTVDDVFMITGRGVVATGQVESGTLAVGATVQVVRDGTVIATSEVSGIEKFRAVIDTAQPGENVGLLLRGVTREELRSGDVVQA